MSSATVTGPVWFVWYGGGSYSSPSWTDDAEQAASIKAAVDVLLARRWNRDGQTPAVDDSSSAVVFYADPSGDSDPYPDTLIEFSAVCGHYVMDGVPCFQGCLVTACEDCGEDFASDPDDTGSQCAECEARAEDPDVCEDFCSLAVDHVGPCA